MGTNTYFGSGAWRAHGGGYLAEGYFASGAAADVEEHGHDLAHIVFLLHSGYASAARRAPERTTGPAIIFNPAGVEHADKFVGGASAFVTISFAPSFLDPFDLPRVATYFEDVETLRQARLLHGRGLRAGAPSEGAFDSAVLELVDQALGQGARPVHDSKLVTRAKLILLDVAQPASSIGALAEALNTHPVHLARAFRHAEGCSPCAFRAAARVTRGAELLRRTQSPITQIAHDLGFADHAHFTREFRKFWGLPPRAYRRAH